MKNKLRSFYAPRKFFCVLSSVLAVWLFLVSTVLAANFSFVILGDSRDGDDVFLDLIQKVNAEKNIALVFHTGDFVSSGKDIEYVKYLKLKNQFKAPVYHVPGNHDVVFGGRDRFLRYFGPTYYSFDYQSSHFVVLDNSFDRYLTDDQFAWLKNDLTHTSADNIFVFLHRPLFDPAGVLEKSVMESRTKAQQLQHIFEKYRVRAVFAGHIHGFEQAQLNGVNYIITGGAGAPLYLPEAMGGYYHYVVAKVQGRQVEYTVKRVYD